MEGALAKIRDCACSKVSCIAIAVKGDGTQQHAGILYQGNHEVQLLELRWHRQLRDDPPDDGYLWAEPNIEPEVALNIARLCNILGRKYVGKQKGPKYAFRYLDDYTFDPDGNYAPTCNGFTCATFVLAVFRTRSVTLLQTATWKERPEDKEWQTKIIGGLSERARSDPHIDQHIEALRRDVGCFRYRPEEVAAAAICETLPAGFAFAVAAGRRIVERLALR